MSFSNTVSWILACPANHWVVVFLSIRHNVP
jgi:hypothetical protein